MEILLDVKNVSTVYSEVLNWFLRKLLAGTNLYIDIGLTFSSPFIIPEQNPL
jgi:hypothetical protein